MSCSYFCRQIYLVKLQWIEKNNSKVGINKYLVISQEQGKKVKYCIPYIPSRKGPEKVPRVYE